MADYQMILTLGGKSLYIPVLPEKLEVQSPGKNETATVLQLGEINILRKKGLRGIQWESFFPAQDAPYVTGQNLLEPSSYVRAINDFRRGRKPARFSIYGTDLDMNFQVGIESFEYREQGGEPGDIYYSITLKEWKDYGAVAVSIPSPKKAVKQPAARSGSPEESKSHTVVKGDCLWNLAQKYYGDGSKWPQLYEKNKALIDKANQGTGLPKATIYPNQKLIL